MLRDRFLVRYGLRGSSSGDRYRLTFSWKGCGVSFSGWMISGFGFGLRPRFFGGSLFGLLDVSFLMDTDAGGGRSPSKSWNKSVSDIALIFNKNKGNFNVLFFI
jgi:hypothetical protein